MSNNKSDAVVYVVDDDFAVCDSLALLIESTGQTVRSFESAKAFLNNYDPGYPGCLLLDVRMPSMNGLELQEELLKRAISIPIIFISGHAGIPDSAKAFRTGAVDFLEKPFDNEILLERIEESIKIDIASREQLNQNREILKRFEHLTAREKEVLKLVVNGYSSKEAAIILDISNRTVETHRYHVMEKMRAESLAELIVMATQCDRLNSN